jgi:hypothetical protein
MSGAISKDNPLMKFAQASTATTTLPQSEKIVKDNLNAIEVAGGNGRTPFVWAAGVTGAYNLAYALIKAGANPNVTYMVNKTVLSELLVKTNLTNADIYIIYLITRSNTGSPYPTFEEFMNSMKISNRVRVLPAASVSVPSASVSGPSAARVSGPSSSVSGPSARVSGPSAATTPFASTPLLSSATAPLASTPVLSAATEPLASAPLLSVTTAPLASTPVLSAAPVTQSGIPLYLLDYNGNQNLFEENSQIAVKLIPAPHERSDNAIERERDRSFENPVKNGMTVTWKTGSAKVRDNFIGNNPGDGMVHNVIYITLDKAVDTNEKVFYLQPSGGYRKKTKRRRNRKSKQTKRR